MIPNLFMLFVLLPVRVAVLSYNASSLLLMLLLFMFVSELARGFSEITSGDMSPEPERTDVGPFTDALPPYG